MTITLTHLTDRSRVRVQLAGYPDGAVQVQRVANASATDALWARHVVRGADALPIESGAGEVSDYEFFADVENHIRTVPVDPSAGLLVTDNGADHASTPDHASLDVSNDLDIRVDMTLDSYVPGSISYIVSKYRFDVDQRAYTLRLSSSGVVELAMSHNGTAFETASSGATVPVEGGQRVALRAVLALDAGDGSYAVTFYHASTIDGAWTQLGSVASGTLGGTSLHASTAPLVVGATSHGTNPVGPGVIHAAEVRDDGTVVADPRFEDEQLDASPFTDDAGRAWTMQGSARINGASAAEQITPSLSGEVWLKSIRYPALNRAVKLVDRGESIDRESRSHVHPVAGRNVGVGQHDKRLGREFTLHLITQGPDHLDEAGEWDLILSVATIWFVHVPAASQVPGGYVAIGDTSQRSLYRGDPDAPQVIDIPCTVEAPPSPRVSGALLVGETVLRLYGSPSALYAAHSTGRSLLATLADSEDLVTL